MKYFDFPIGYVNKGPYTNSYPPNWNDIIKKCPNGALFSYTDDSQLIHYVLPFLDADMPFIDLTPAFTELTTR